MLQQNDARWCFSQKAHLAAAVKQVNGVTRGKVRVLSELTHLRHFHVERVAQHCCRMSKSCAVAAMSVAAQQQTVGLARQLHS